VSLNVIYYQLTVVTELVTYSSLWPVTYTVSTIPLSF